MTSSKARCFNLVRVLGVGSALVVVLWLAAVAAPAQTFNTLVSLDSDTGAQPFYLSLVQGRDGSLYGTTTSAGANHEGGTVFRVNLQGGETTLYSFCAQPSCADGMIPIAGLVLATDGNFYGTTAYGGNTVCNDGCGTVFRISPKGVLTTLYDFCAESNCADGSVPFAGLIQATDGNLYGTTMFRGPGNSGTVFKINLQGVLTTLHTLGGEYGYEPFGGLIQATDGNLYGTTAYLGSHGGGTIFRITPKGNLTISYNFCAQPNCTDGSHPEAGLIQATDGDLYGTTYQGGTSNAGTVFKIIPGGKLTTLYSFCAQSNCSDGASPEAGLVQATDGNFYGTTYGGGAGGAGTIFTISSSGALTTLHSFDDTDGASPLGGISQATNGTLYGTTQLGGAYGDGTVFSLSMGLSPFVTFVRGVGRVGAKVEILGQGFTGTTGVSFNGTLASFTVRRDTFLVATVPQGATTGYVTVTTPSGTLQSNVPFRVRQ